MARRTAIGLTVTAALVFGWVVPIARLFDVFQQLTVALSIMAAAVLVRLNRGMPTLDWKSVQAGERSQLTRAVLSLSVEYAWVFAIDAVVLAGIVAISAVGKTQVTCEWTSWAQRGAAAGIGGGLALCAARMAYVVWRDVDIVRLQKGVIDRSASREQTDSETATAAEKVTNMRGAALRSVPLERPRVWGE